MSMVWPTLESRTAKEQKGEDHSSPMIENQGHRSVSKIRQKCQKCTPLAYSSEAYKGPAALLNQLKIKKMSMSKIRVLLRRPVLDGRGSRFPKWRQL